MSQSTTTPSPEFKTETPESLRYSPSAGRSVLGITMARGGSKGVPRKNLRMVAGKELIRWTIEEARKCSLLTRYVVSTDDLEIRKIAEEYGAELEFMEPYSDGTNPLIERLQYVVKGLESRGEKYDIVADIRCTNPLKTSNDIDGMIHMLLDTGADVVCGITRLEDHHPSRIKMMLPDKRLVDVWPEPKSGLRQDLTPDVYIRNGSVYVVRTEALMRGIHFSGGDIRGYELPLERSLNIDSEFDLKVAEVVLSHEHPAR